jgi:hypothetical protein
MDSPRLQEDEYDQLLRNAIERYRAVLEELAEL